MCAPKALGEEPPDVTADNKGLAHWIGSASHVQALYVWVSAHWTTSVYGVVKARTTQFDARRDYELQVLRAGTKYLISSLKETELVLVMLPFWMELRFFSSLWTCDLIQRTFHLLLSPFEHRGWSYQLRTLSIP